jgi:hypothetical protein
LLQAHYPKYGSSRSYSNIYWTTTNNNKSTTLQHAEILTHHAIDIIEELMCDNIHTPLSPYDVWTLKTWIMDNTHLTFATQHNIQKTGLLSKLPKDSCKLMDLILFKDLLYLSIIEDNIEVARLPPLLRPILPLPQPLLQKTMG